MRKFLMSAVLSVAAVAAGVPASAQAWRAQPRIQREIQSDINGLDRQIARAIERGTVSRRDAKDLRREASNLQRTFNRFSRDGLDRREVEQLESQVNGLHRRLRLEQRNWGGRR